MRRWLTAGIIGATLTWFLDPNSGARRRNITRDKLLSWTRRGGRKIAGEAEYVAGHAQGVVAETIPIKHDNPNPDDITLKDRVESEIFRDSKLGRENINVDVVDRAVTIRGELPSQGEIDSLIARIGGIRDVKKVNNLLHLPGTVAPNKEAAIKAS